MVIFYFPCATTKGHLLPPYSLQILGTEEMQGFGVRETQISGITYSKGNNEGTGRLSKPRKSLIYVCPTVKGRIASKQQPCRLHEG